MSVKLIGEKFCRIPWEDRKEKGSLRIRLPSFWWSIAESNR